MEVLGNIISLAGGLVDFIFDLKFNEKKRILQGNFISSSLSLIALLCLRAYDGVINCIVTILRLATIYIKDKYHKKCRFLFIVFFILYCFVFFDFAGIQTIVLFLSTICSFVPKWISTDMQKIRLGSLTSYILIIIYNLLIGNILVIPLDIVYAILTVVTLTKWAKKPNGKSTQKSNNKTAPKTTKKSISKITRKR